MSAFLIHIVAMIMIALAALQPSTPYSIRVRVGFGGIALWTAGDLVAQWIAFGPPWGR